MFKLSSSVAAKQVLTNVVLGAIPLAIVALMALTATGDIEADIDERLAQSARDISDKIDRNLHERYGDAQAFALNRVVQDKEHWYQPESPIIDALNAYTAAYAPNYSLMMLVDLEGRVVAVNSRDDRGSPLATAALYQRNFAGDGWFKAVAAGQWTTTMPFADKRNTGASGTYVEDLYLDEDVKRLFPDSEGLTLGFAAPVRDAAGAVVGYWKNYARFQLVEEILLGAYEELVRSDYGDAALTVMDATGVVIADVAPGVHKEPGAHHDMSQLMKFNSVQGGNAAARRAVAGESGAEHVTSKRRAREEVVGFAHLDGALDFPGMNWSIMVALPHEHAYAVAHRLELLTGLAVILGVLFTLGFGTYFGRRSARHITRMADAARHIAQGDIDQPIPAHGDDEMALLARSLQDIAATLKSFNCDLETLVSKARAGELDHRADVSQYAGAYRDVMDGSNSILEAFAGPVRELRNVLSRAAEGDLTGHLSGNYQGEYATLQEAWNSTADSLNSALSVAVAASERVDHRSRQIRETSQAQANGAAEQAATIEEISAQMTQMSGQTRDNAESAQQARDLARTAADGATRGDRAMGEMVEAMGKIQGASKDISRIIKVIDEIAFQTNLLALNAAVEAARAGVHGKGFAVVAEEVRNLAGRSAQAARETTEMIESSIDRVELGTRIAHETAAALGRVVSGIAQVNDHVGRIAQASGDQAEGISQINGGLAQLNLVIQDGTARSEESAAAALELSADAANLNEHLARFELFNDDGARPAPPAAQRPSSRPVASATVLPGFGLPRPGSRSGEPRSRRAPRPITRSAPRPAAAAPAAPSEAELLALFDDAPSAPSTGSASWSPNPISISLDDDDFGKF